MSSVERMVPVPGMSPGAFTVFSGVLVTGGPAQALHEAVRAGKVRASDLPEMIANVWTRDDSPTTGLSEAGWVQPLAISRSRAVGASAGFPRTGTDRFLRHCQDVADLLVEEVVVAVDAVAGDSEQDCDAISGPGSDLGGRSSGC